MATGLERLRERLATISDLGRAGALLGWDERTHMPPAGREARAEQLATVARIGHDLLISDELGALLDEAAAEVDGLPYDSDDASIVRMVRREWGKAHRVPTELHADLARAASLGEHAWAEAREHSDFARFLPYLERNVELRRRYIECLAGFDGFEHPYDPLLDDFEPGVSTAEVRAVLERLRDGILPLIEAVSASGVVIDDSCLYGHFPLGAQEALARQVVAELPLEPGAWRLDSSVHPFATAMAPSDIRITTRFDEAFVGTSLWSVIHEAGHGMYENGAPRDLARTLVGSPNSLGFHESQSRMWENWVGRGRPYLERLHPRLRELFPDAFGPVDADAVYRAANKIEPSLIRVEADQVTYNLHIVLRVELEIDIFDGRIELADLPEAWNARVADYLGLQVPEDAQGVLQDVHWSGGLFGYFATYCLGNIIAAQIWDAVNRDLPDLEAEIGRGELGPLHDWLGERLYLHGGKFLPRELIERVVGGPLDVAPYLRQLGERVAEIYGV